MRPDHANQQTNTGAREAARGVSAELQYAVENAFPGRFSALRLLGAGTGAATLEAVESRQNTKRVIKAFDTRLISTGMRLRLDRDASHLKRVHCEASAKLLDWESTADHRFGVFQFVPGEPLSSVVPPGGLGVDATLVLAIRCLEALRALHAENITHANVSAHAVLLPDADPGRAALVGFGPLRASQGTAEQEQENLRHAQYCSPELSGAIEYDLGPWSDLYSLGVVLHLSAAGELPFAGPDVGSVLFQHMTAPVPSLRSRGVAAAPAALEAMLQHMLRKDPRSRYQSAAAALEDAQAILHALRAGDSDPRIAIGARDRRRTISEPGFIGRRHELDQFSEQLARARAGHGGLVLLEAPSGGGKSRLQAEFAQVGRQHGAWVLRGQETNDAGRRNLQMLDGVVTELLASTPQVAAQLRERLQADASTLAAVLPRLAPLLGESPDQSVPEQFAESRALRALTTLLDSLGTPARPAVVFLDDCQWADALALRLLRLWAARQDATGARHVLVVAAFRTEEAPPDHPLRALQGSAHMRLDPLGDQDIRQLLESMAGNLPESILEVVTRLAEGSPFMATAVLLGLQECGALSAGEDGWRVDERGLRECQSSEKAADLLTRRVGLLSPDAFELLSIGALLGKEFDLSLASRLMQVDPNRFVESLDEAKQKRLVWVKPDRTGCVFVHDKIRTAVLQGLSPSRARQIHLSAAVLLCGRPGASEADIAYHFDACGDHKSALHFALSAAQHARARHALDIAEEQYRIAERGVPADDHLTSFRIQEGLGDVYMLKGRYDRAAECFTQASPLAEGAHASAQIRGKLAELSFKRGDMEQAVVEYEAALRRLGMRVPRVPFMFGVMLVWQGFIQLLHTLAPRLFLHRRKSLPDASLRLRLRLLSGLTHAYWYARGRSMVFWAHLAGMNQAEKHLPSEELADAYSSHGVGMTLFGLISRAEAYCRKSLEIRQQQENLWGQGQTLHYWGVVLYAASRFHECVSKCRESVRLLERMGDFQQVHTARYQTAASLYHLGDFKGAVEEAARNHQSGLLTGDAQATGINLDVWARAAPRDVPRELIQAERDRERYDVQGAAQVALAHAVTLIEEEQEQEALAVLQQAIRETYGRGVKNAYTAPLLAWAATAARRLAERTNRFDAARSRQTLRQALRITRRGVRGSWACRNDLPRLLRESAYINALLGRPSRARRSLRLALRVAKRQRARHEFAMCLQAYGEIGQAVGWIKASERLASARRTLDLLAVRSQAGQDTLQQATGSSLSLMDRFDTVLESGRSIASSLTAQAIHAQTQAAALRLLRGQECVVWECGPGRGADFRVVAGGGARLLAPDNYRELLEESSAWAPRLAPLVTADGRALEQGSVLTAPILVRGRVAAVMAVAHEELNNLFRHEELRLAEFIATIAGAALENAAGYQQLQNLNATLEARVDERTATAESRARELAASNEELLRVATELRKTEDELRIAMRAAEAASEAKSQFLATMSHEIRTPMNGILGMTELALQAPLTPQLTTYLKTVKQSGEALLTLLNDVLDLSKIEAGKMDIEQIEFDIRQVVGDAVKLMSAAAAKKNIELLCDIAPRTPRLVLGDPVRLRQVIVNLVGNAVKFTEVGEVTLSVEISPRLRRGWALKFAVADTGPGIPKDKQEKVFAAFQQSDGSTTRKYGGTGLGLSISTELVGLMGGKIWLESEPGEGSTFFFEIPLATAEVAEPVTDSRPRLNAVTAIVVSASQSAARLYVDALGRYGAETHAVHPDKLADAAAAHPDDAVRLAVIDLSNRDGAGHAVAEQWNPLAQEHAWKTIWLTPIDWVDGALPLLDGVRLTKPATSHDLLNAAIEAMHGAAAVAPADDSPAAAPSVALKILLVDDSSINQQVGAGLLATKGHRVATADNGAEAVKQLEAEDFDVVLMDLEMPVMDGFEATHRIRQRDSERGVHTVIVAMTAHALAVVREKCQAAHMDACLTKPIQPERLFSELQRLCVERPRQLVQTADAAG